MKFIKLYLILFVTFFCLSFTFINQSNYKVIRYMSTTNGFLISEYFDGVLKKQVKNKQISTFQLSFSDTNLIEKEILRLDVNNIVEEIEDLDEPMTNPSIMYLFIKNNDTIRTKFFSPSKTPVTLKKLDYQMNKNRLN